MIDAIDLVFRSLILAAVARSVPSGFSSTTRALGVATAASAMLAAVAT